MSTTLLLLWAITGGALAHAIMMRLWLPDPPPRPEIIGRYLVITIAGIVGGAVGGYVGSIAHAGSDPMPALPAIVGAASGGLILSGAVGFLGGAGRKVAH